MVPGLVVLKTLFSRALLERDPGKFPVVNCLIFKDRRAAKSFPKSALPRQRPVQF
jgi:hypothetical protein